MIIDDLKGLQDAHNEMGVVLVDDKGQLTFMGCMFLLTVHLSAIEFLRGKSYEKQNKT